MAQGVGSFAQGVGSNINTFAQAFSQNVGNGLQNAAQFFSQRPNAGTATSNPVAVVQTVQPLNVSPISTDNGLQPQTDNSLQPQPQQKYFILIPMVSNIGSGQIGQNNFGNGQIDHLNFGNGPVGQSNFGNTATGQTNFGQMGQSNVGNGKIGQTKSTNPNVVKKILTLDKDMLFETFP